MTMSDVCAVCGARVFEKFTGRTARSFPGRVIWVHAPGSKPADGHQAAPKREASS
ncbi:hypothetical protein [Candidatus Protofrankia californiensis]|uniref:hypothetical protein n=1 Tax=Candidatus Protofrankia californiensis TaxID=1839754 RepID=UPI0013EC10D7|nr:hypothetical protein [Candidatus Protofrankia californiensis]